LAFSLIELILMLRIARCRDIERDLVKTLEMYMGPVETVEATEMKSLKDINLDEEDGSGPTS
jgi:hypothetical protein